MSNALGQNRYLPRKEVFENGRMHGIYRIKWDLLKQLFRAKIRDYFSKVFLGD